MEKGRRYRERDWGGFRQGGVGRRGLGRRGRPAAWPGWWPIAASRRSEPTASQSSTSSPSRPRTHLRERNWEEKRENFGCLNCGRRLPPIGFSNFGEKEFSGKPGHGSGYTKWIGSMGLNGRHLFFFVCFWNGVWKPVPRSKLLFIEKVEYNRDAPGQGHCV